MRRPNHGGYHAPSKIFKMGHQKLFGAKKQKFVFHPPITEKGS